MSDVPPKLSVQSLKDIVADAGELAKGAQIFDGKGLANLSRYQLKLFADAKGSGAAPYKVQIVFDEKVKGRCSCMAARSRPFCKHAAALLFAWARAPDGFAVSDVAPAAAGAGDAKKKTVKASKVDAAALMKSGVEQTATLTRELAVTGVASLGADRPEQIAALATGLRENRLRRLSARVLTLSELVATASSGAEFDVEAYAELFGDLVLTVKKLEKHLAGEALEPAYVEELIGKTWTKKDRQPSGPHRLVEYAFSARTTPDDFLIRESRFLDVATGTHFSEKQILPAFLAKRTDPKRSYAGLVLEGAQGGQYPGFAPFRLDLEDTGAAQAVHESTVEALLASCLPNVGAALAAFQERKKDVFAPDELPVAVRVEAVIAEHGRLQVVDDADAALFLPTGAVFEEQLATVLRGGTLRALLGDVALDGALPTLYPLAAIVEGPGGLAVRVLAALDAAAVLSSKKLRASATTATATRGWSEVARAAGVSEAAVSLGEVRNELAAVLVSGLAALTPRVATPLSARLRDLGMVKQGDLLDALTTRADAAERLEDFVKLHRVLGIALARLAGATHVERARFEPVPTFDSVQVRKSDEVLEPSVIVSRVSAGSLNRYEAAAYYARYYARLGVDELAKNVFPTWADGAAQPYVARTLASRPDLAIPAAERVLSVELNSDKRWWWSNRPLQGRMVKLTACRVLEAVGTRDAANALKARLSSLTSSDESLGRLARLALRRLEARVAGKAFERATDELTRIAELQQQLINGNDKGTRMQAGRALADNGWVEGIPWLRASMRGDISSDVRESSASALGALGDVESVDTFITMLRNRGTNWEDAKVAAYALASLGDSRAVDEVLDAWAEGWNPSVVTECLRLMRGVALVPMIERVEKTPELISKKAALRVMEAVEPTDLLDALRARITLHEGSEDFIALATVWVKLAAMNRVVLDGFRQAVLEARPSLGGPTDSKEGKALFKKLDKLS